MKISRKEVNELQITLAELQQLIHKFIGKSPEFEGDEKLATEIGTKLGDFYNKIANLK